MAVLSSRILSDFAAPIADVFERSSDAPRRASVVAFSRVSARTGAIKESSPDLGVGARMGQRRFRTLK